VTITNIITNQWKILHISAIILIYYKEVLYLIMTIPDPPDELLPPPLPVLGVPAPLPAPPAEYITGFPVIL
jgi:hypothetical protein